MAHERRAASVVSSAHRNALGAPGRFDAVVAHARLRVLRFTVVLALLIATGNLIGSIAGFSPSGEVRGPATWLACAWCGLWMTAACFPSIVARLVASWRRTALGLGVANAATLALTGGIESPLAAVCVHAGWIASVVVTAPAALMMSGAVSCSIVGGYVLAGDSIDDLAAGPYRYDAIANVVLPLVAGFVGVLLASVANSILSRLASTLCDLRAGAPATTDGLTALLAGDFEGAVPALVSDRLDATPVASDRPVSTAPDEPPLTRAERDIVRLLADGLTPQQIARRRGVKESTIRSQLKTAKAKTGARTLAELALRAEAIR